jgi:hypothetical protein
MSTQHTPGPWFADRAGKIWRRDPKDLYENGGGVAGDKPVATANVGWYGDDVVGFPVEANARLIAAAPDLLTRLRAAANYIDTLGGDSRECRIAIAKAEGKS